MKNRNDRLKRRKLIFKHLLLLLLTLIRGWNNVMQVQQSVHAFIKMKIRGNLRLFYLQFMGNIQHENEMLMHF